MICSVPECGEKHAAKGFCKKHYARYLKHGDPHKKLMAGGKVRPLINRFSEKHIPITETGCWIWLAAIDPNGYGRIGKGKAVRLAHRVSWELHKGKIPDGMYVLHRCDNPLCVNPEHLFLGTQKQNVADMVGKGRGNWVHGESNGKTKITESLARKVLSAKGKLRVVETARKYELPQSTVRGIWKRERWKYL